MLSVHSGRGITSSYVYDAFDRRISRTLNGTQLGTVHDGLREVHTATGSTIDSTLLNGPGLDERYARAQGGNTNVILPDAPGSTLHLLSPGGGLSATFTYEPYGTATQSGTDNAQYRYTGREDDGTGLMYYRARYYSPRTARFLSADPIGLAGGVNLYGYVGGIRLARLIRWDWSRQMYLAALKRLFISLFLVSAVALGALWDPIGRCASTFKWAAALGLECTRA